MGMESAVYRFVPSVGSSTPYVSALVAAGAEKRDSGHLVLRGLGHWIDIQVDVPAPSVGLRVAFSNPVVVVAEVRRVIAVLASTGPGELVDPARRRRFSIADYQQVNELLTDFEGRRSAFQRDFGPFEAAVSADDVFRLMRERPAE